jgi:hypothetical protein
MKRRKFVLGLGSIAAGGAAAMGAGAITESHMERGVRGRVAADGPDSAYVEVDPSSNAGNEEHVSFDSTTGEMYLDFGDIGSGGAGLNPDSLNQFDVIFFLRNQNPSGNNTHTYWLWIESPSDRLDFYVDSNPPGTLEGISNAQEMSRNGQGIPEIPVGVAVDLRDSGLNAGDDLTSLFDEDDQFVLHMEKTNGSPP